MRIKVLCEGDTEEGLRALLAKAVDIKGCGILIKNCRGIGKLRSKLDNKIVEELRSGAQVVFCVVDYHNYPAENRLTASNQTAERIDAIKKDLLSNIDQSRQAKVRCHIAVHEVEAWILADEQAIAQRLRLNKLGHWPQPEVVNDDKHPAVVLENLFRKHLKIGYDKYKDGVNLLKKIDCQKVYDKCPTFKQLVDDLRGFCNQITKN